MRRFGFTHYVPLRIRVVNPTCGQVSVSKLVDNLLALRALAGSRAAEDEHHVRLPGHLDSDVNGDSTLESS